MIYWTAIFGHRKYTGKVSDLSGMPEGVTGTPYERGWSIVGLKGKREAAHRAGRRPHLGFLVGLGLGGGAPPLLILSPFFLPVNPTRNRIAILFLVGLLP